MNFFKIIYTIQVNIFFYVIMKIKIKSELYWRLKCESKVLYKHETNDGPLGLEFGSRIEGWGCEKNILMGIYIWTYSLVGRVGNSCRTAMCALLSLVVRLNKLYEAFWPPCQARLGFAPTAAANVRGFRFQRVYARQPLG